MEKENELKMSKKMGENKQIISKVKHEILIPNSMMNHINQLHREVGEVEWSGILLFEHGGSIQEGLKLVAKGLFPMNIGHATYTEFSSGKKMQEIEKLHTTWEDEDWRCGLCHSHHSMRTFASGTDIDEIKTNASLHDYYVSLIVNFSGQYTCKIGVYSEDSHVINRFRINPLTNTKEHIGSFNRVEKNVEILDCEIKYEDNDVISEVIKALKNSQNKSRTFSSGKYSAEDYVWENPKWDKLSNVKQTSLFGVDQRFKPKKEKVSLDNATMLDMVIETLMLDEEMQGDLFQISIEVENVIIQDSYFISILSKIEAIVNAYLTLKSIQEIMRDINQYAIDYEAEEIEYLIKHLSKYKNIKLIFEELLKEKISDGL